MTNNVKKTLSTLRSAMLNLDYDPYALYRLRHIRRNFRKSCGLKARMSYGSEV